MPSYYYVSLQQRNREQKNMNLKYKLVFIIHMPGYFCPIVLFYKQEQWYPTM